jgi:hypothetical protein
MSRCDPLWAKRYYSRIVEDYGQTPSAQMAMLRLGLETRQPLEQRAALLLKAHEQDPSSSDGERALFQLGFMYYAHKKPRESMDALTRFVRRYPQSRLVGFATMFIEEQQASKP